ncbi:MAG: 3-deoxy-D-manno-octulosonic acid transferase [Longimicrobiales bacterium]
MRSAPLLLRLVAPFNDKLRRGLAGRDRALEQLERWCALQRRTERPLFWVHAPSVGEALMAQAIVSALRAQRPELQIAFTHFSPSAERMRERVGADVATYLPWDATETMQRALALLQPAGIVFVRSEVWPTLARLARHRGVPVLLVNAVLSPTSSRLRPLARYALQPAYQELTAVGAIDAAAAARFELLNVPRARIVVTGDARFDQVWQRVETVDRSRDLLRRLADPTVTTIVAGSSWPTDEEHLIPVFRRMLSARLILAPHEPTEPHLKRLEKMLEHGSLTHARLAHVEAHTDALPAVVLVDRVGVLADLYAIADLAYVGGAFHSAGVHSVVEPAALGVPVIFGPQHENATEAQQLINAGGGLSIDSSNALTVAFLELVADTRKRTETGGSARNYVQSKLGGARRNAELILQQIDPVTPL